MFQQMTNGFSIEEIYKKDQSYIVTHLRQKETRREVEKAIRRFSDRNPRGRATRFIQNFTPCRGCADKNSDI